MTARTPDIAPPALASLVRKTGDVHVLVHKYELITPLFGGGVEPGINDEITPITGKTIRGQLRFWWRATRGGEFGGGRDGLLQMKECEDAIWGGASLSAEANASAVIVEVLLGPYKKIGQSESPYLARHHPNPDWANLIYAAFPFQNDPHPVSKYRFDLKLSLPEVVTSRSGKTVVVRQELEAALWAWETFGGVGARTRRGFGALKRLDGEDLPRDPEKIEERIRVALNKYVSPGEFPEGVPHLSADLSFALATSERFLQVGPKKVKRRDSFGSYNEAWEALIVGLKSFRQPRPTNSVPHPEHGRMVPRPGRTKWNEPERIREITNQRLERHERRPDLVAVEKFSRAQFGQPIIFQFHRDQKNREGSNDPKLDPIDTILKGGPLPGNPNKTRERLASPLIMRPLACAASRAVGLAAILRTARVAPEGLYLSGEGVNRPVDLTITKKDAMKIEPLRKFASRLANDDDEVDVLEAFIEGFRKQEDQK
jgi:CRISPR-associated protein Cmr1